MPKQKDSFICKWLSGSGHVIRERVILYEAASSFHDDASEASSSPYHKKQKPAETTSFNNKNTNARKAMFRGFLMAIYVCLEELAVLKRFCRRPFEPIWNEPLVYKDLEQLYNSLDESYDMFKLDDMRKSLRDICILFNILANTFLEMQKEEKFTTVEKSADILCRQLQDEVALMDETKYMLKYKEYLILSLIKEKSESKQELNNICEEASRSILTYEDELGFARSENYYNNDWESARLEQKMWLDSKESQELEDTISKCKENIFHENRVHIEIQNYCTEYIQDLNIQIDEWQSKYETELERDDSKLIYLRNEMELQTIKLADLKKLYESHQREMSEWIAYRTEKQIADELEKKINQAVVKIQAWWRGVMFRKKLGPYRKKKKGKGKGKGGKKGANAKKK